PCRPAAPAGYLSGDAPEPGVMPSTVLVPDRRRSAPAMIIHLVRHAHAGNRSAWTDDDSQRPLSEKGRAQATAIAAALVPELSARSADHHGSGPVELWSSPFVRCVQTLEPLGVRLDLEVDRKSVV